MLKVVVYYRSRKTRNLIKGTAVTLLQKSAIELWAADAEEGPESGHWTIIGQYHDNYRGRDNQKKSDLPGLNKAITHCEKDDATLVFVNIKIWRPNPFIDDKIDDFIRKNGSNRVYVIPTTSGNGADEIREFFQKKREERIRKQHGARIKKGIRKAKKARGTLRDPEDLKKAQIRGGNMKRAKSLSHLIQIAPYILKFDEQGLINQEIARRLNKMGKLTVSGKDWTSASVSKVRAEVLSDGFQDRVIAAMEFMYPDYRPTKQVKRLPN